MHGETVKNEKITCLYKTELIITLLSLFKYLTEKIR
jgi:hypothetical protein